MPPLADATVAETVIAPGQGGLLGSLAECWRQRDLLYFLAWRDVKVRYKQTLLGAAWAVLQPLVTMIVFILIFGRMAGVTGTPGVPYPVFCLAGLLPWYLFQSALTQSSSSVVSQAALVTKVYFPRLLVPISAVGSALVDFCVSLTLLAGIMAFYAPQPEGAGIALSPRLLLLPFFVLLAVAAALSVGLWFAALNAKYRDFRYVVPFLVRIGLFLSPVGYGAKEFLAKTSLPASFRWIFSLNPMTGVLEGFRWALFGSSELDVESMMVSAGAVLVILIGGLLYFRRMERQFADTL